MLAILSAYLCKGSLVGIAVGLLTLQAHAQPSQSSALVPIIKETSLEAFGEAAKLMNAQGLAAAPVDLGLGPRIALVPQQAPLASPNFVPACTRCRQANPPPYCKYIYCAAPTLDLSAFVMPQASNICSWCADRLAKPPFCGQLCNTVLPPPKPLDLNPLIQRKMLEITRFQVEDFQQAGKLSQPDYKAFLKGYKLESLSIQSPP